MSYDSAFYKADVMPISKKVSWKPRRPHPLRNALYILVVLALPFWFILNLIARE